MIALSDLEAVVDQGVRVGVTDLEPFPVERARIEGSLARGLSGGLAFTYATPAASTTPAETFPWARSIVVVVVPYLVDGDADDGSASRTVARFADGDRYAGVRSALSAVSGTLERSGFRTEMVFDDNRLVDRAVAVRSGVAWNGKSTMVITPLHGPWILIGSVVTDAPLESTTPMVRGCGTCTACIPACPTQAIIEPGVLDASLCLAAVLQRPGPIPRSLRKAVGTRLYGCDECLTACPPGDGALLRTSGAEHPMAPVDILGMTDRELDDTFSHWYVPKRSMRFLRRNAVVALGNTGTHSDLGVLAGLLGHPDAMLRQHAAWAVGNIGGAFAGQILVSALQHETDPVGREEISLALATTGEHAVYADGSRESLPEGTTPE
jgi:epoxyqueuosine reductase